jgi:hypothetical protein
MSLTTLLVLGAVFTGGVVAGVVLAERQILTVRDLQRSRDYLAARLRRGSKTDRGGVNTAEAVVGCE